MSAGEDARRTAEARRAAALEKVREAGEFTTDDLMRIAGLPQGTARSYVKHWEQRGDIVMTRKDAKLRYFCAAERLADIARVPQGGTEEGNMWRAMRLLGSFSALTLATHANAGGVEVSVEKAQAYCRALLEAGYLRVIEKAKPGRRKAMYRLIVNSGPQAPVVRRMSMLHDPNTGQFLPTARRGAA